VIARLIDDLADICVFCSPRARQVDAATGV
jgi:hypothetical protein